MKLITWSLLRKSAVAVLALSGTLCTVRSLAGEAVLMAPPPSSMKPMAVAEDETNNELTAFVPSYDNRDNSLPQPFQFGPVILRPHPYYQFLYVSGLQSGTNNTQRTIIQNFSPGIAADLGRHWMVDYTPTLHFYSNRAFQNTIDQAATLTGNTRYDDWVFNLSQSFAQTESTLVETASQSREQVYDTELGANYQINDHYYMELGLSQVFDFVRNSQDSRVWSTLDWLNYEVNKRLVFGVGAGGGYVHISSETALPANPDESFEQMAARVQWRATDKLSFSVNAGFEDRQTLATGYKDQLNPTFGAGAQYQPFDHTQITLSAGRSVSASDYFVLAQSVESTSVNLGLTQRMLEVYYLTLGGSYTKTQYTATLGSASDVRSDNTYNFNVRLGRNFLKRGSVALTYQYSDNQSNQSGFSYSSNQVGFEVGFAY